MKMLTATLVAVLAMSHLSFAAGTLTNNALLIASIRPQARDHHISLHSDSGMPVVELYAISPEFRRLAAMLTNTWQQSLDNIETLAPDAQSRLILLGALLFLPPEEYVKCLDHLLDLYQQKRIPRDEFLYVFWLPPRIENAWFLSFNYTHPQVIAFLKRARATFKDDKDMVSFTDFILSGHAKSRDQWQRRDDPALSEREVPLLPKP